MKLIHGNLISFLVDASIPVLEYATAGSSGFDVYASIKEPINILPNERVLIPTGIWLTAVDTSLELQVRSKSGLTLKKGLVVANGVGTIDSDYKITKFSTYSTDTNEYTISDEDYKNKQIQVILHNISNDTQIIEPYSKIAQIVLCPVMREYVLLNSNVRTGGFGSTN